MWVDCLTLILHMIVFGDVLAGTAVVNDKIYPNSYFESLVNDRIS